MDKVFYFALNYLRYIIVITQLVVIAVFFYRFQIDQKIIDLKEAVDQKKEIVNIVLPLLKEAERIDKKTTEIDKIINNQNSFSSMISYLSVEPRSDCRSIWAASTRSSEAWSRPTKTSVRSLARVIAT